MKGALKRFDKIVYNIPPTNSTERFDQITEFFDGWECEPGFKQNLLTTLRLNWAAIYESETPFLWLDKKNKEQCEWAWSYIKEKGIPSYYIFNPLNDAERYNATYATFDLWNAHRDTKKLFLIKMKRAWDQRRFRKKQSGKKPLNTFLKEDTKIKLDFLARQGNQKIHETLERLINVEYEKTIYPYLNFNGSALEDEI